MVGFKIPLAPGRWNRNLLNHILESETRTIKEKEIRLILKWTYILWGTIFCGSYTCNMLNHIPNQVAVEVLCCCHVVCSGCCGWSQQSDNGELMLPIKSIFLFTLLITATFWTFFKVYFQATRFIWIVRESSLHSEVRMLVCTAFVENI